MNFFRRLFFGPQQSRFSLDQAKAFLDILICIMVADGRQDTGELDEIYRAIAQLRAEDRAEIENYVEMRRREFAEEVDTRVVFAQAAEVLDEPWMREHAYYLAARIAGANNEVHASETEALHFLVSALQLPREKLRLITQRLIEEDTV